MMRPRQPIPGRDIFRKMPLTLTLLSSVTSTFFYRSMTLGRPQIYVNFVAMRNMATAEPAKIEK